MRRLLAALVLALAPAAASAQQTAVTPTATTSSIFAGDTRGFSFTLDRAIEISSLGWFDADLDGLGDSHTVAIWDSSGTLLLSGTVSSGTADPLIGIRVTRRRLPARRC